MTTIASNDNSGSTHRFELTLENVFDDEQAKIYFIKYLETANAADLANFIEMAEEYSNLKSHPNRYRKALDIFEKFLPKSNDNKQQTQQQQQQQSKNIEVNAKLHNQIPIALIETLHAQFLESCSKEHCSKTLFESASSILMIQLKDEIWKSFVPSLACEELLTKCPHFFQPIASRNSTAADDTSSCTESSTSKSERSTINSFNVNTPLFTDFEFETFKRWSLSESSTDDNKWKRVLNNEEVAIFVSTNGTKLAGYEGKSIKLQKTIGYLPVSPELLLKTIAAIEIRAQSDNLFAGQKFLDYRKSDKCKYSSTITHERYRFPIMSDREFVFSSSLKMETFSYLNWKRYIFLRKTIQGIEPPSSKNKTIRGEGICGVIIEQANDENTRCKYYETAWIDLKGSIPATVYNFLITKRGTATHEGMKKNAKKMMAMSDTEIHSSDRMMETLEDYLQKNTVEHSPY